MTWWQPNEVDVLTRAVRAAMPAHTPPPVVLELPERRVVLYECFDVSPPHHDPGGRDRMLHCGTGLANLLLALCFLGWDPAVRLFPGQDRPDQVAEVVPAGRRQPTPAELDRYAAIPRQASHNLPFDATPLSREEFNRVVDAAAVERTGVHRLVGRSEAGILADLLGHTIAVLGQDRACVRELRPWTTPERTVRDRGPSPTAGPTAASMGSRAFARLVRAHVLPSGVLAPTARPPAAVRADRDLLASRIERECVLVVQTVDDGRRDHLLAGVAVQRAWLEATGMGLAASLVTQPLHLAEVRSGLMDALALPGFPQALLRVGYSAPADPTVKTEAASRERRP